MATGQETVPVVPLIHLQCAHAKHIVVATFYCCSPASAAVQATRNGNDLWLSYWVSHTPSAAPAHPHAAHPALLMSHLLAQSPQVSPGLALQYGGMGPRPSPGLWGWTAGLGITLDPEVRVYLGGLIGIAAANSVFTLVGGARPAKRGLRAWATAQ